jgi:hypothetical protein
VGCGHQQESIRKVDEAALALRKQKDSFLKVYEIERARIASKKCPESRIS